jgi:hypothetical protein
VYCKLPTVRISGGVELDEADYEYVKELGEKGQAFHDVNAIRQLQQFFEDNDAIDKANSLTDAINSAIDGIKVDALEVSGMNINYYENLYNGQGGWINSDTGYFIGKLDIQINTTNEAYQQELYNRVTVGFE